METKENIGKRESKEAEKVPICSVCHHTAPWHSMVCPRVSGEYCLECETLLPRHYPWCSIGKRYGFFFWKTPRNIQRELENYFNEHMRNRVVTPPLASVPVKASTGPEKYVVPEEGRQRIKEMLKKLAEHAAVGKAGVMDMDTQ